MKPQEVIIMLHDTSEAGVKERKDIWDVTSNGIVLFTGTSMECIKYCSENKKCIRIH